MKPEKEAHEHGRVVQADFLAALGPTGELPPPTLPELAFAGRSNVGKSSLLNLLLGRRNLVRTSGTPGCTRTVNLFHAKTDDAVELILADLPGYGYAKRAKVERQSWGPLIEGYLKRRASLRGVVVLVDGRREVEGEERELIEFVRTQTEVSRPELGVLVAVTKIDKVPTAERRSRVVALGKAAGALAIGVSSETGEGRAFLWKKLREIAGIPLPAKSA